MHKIITKIKEHAQIKNIKYILFVFAFSLIAYQIQTASALEKVPSSAAIGDMFASTNTCAVSSGFCWELNPPNYCTIPAGLSSCNVYLNWNTYFGYYDYSISIGTYYAEQIGVVKMDDVVISANKNKGWKLFTLSGSKPSYRYVLSYDGIVLKTIDVQAKCELGSAWDKVTNACQKMQKTMWQAINLYSYCDTNPDSATYGCTDYWAVDGTFFAMLNKQVYKPGEIMTLSLIGALGDQSSGFNLLQFSVDVVSNSLTFVTGGLINFGCLFGCSTPPGVYVVGSPVNFTVAPSECHSLLVAGSCFYAMGTGGAQSISTTTAPMTVGVYTIKLRGDVEAIPTVYSEIKFIVEDTPGVNLNFVKKGNSVTATNTPTITPKASIQSNTSGAIFKEKPED